MFSTHFLLFVFIVALARYLWSRRKLYLLSWQMPGPTAYPFVGNALHLSDPENILILMNEQRNKYKTNFRVWLGPKLIVYIYHPDDIQKILTSPDCLDKSSIYRFTEAFLGHGLIVLDKNTWQIHRKLINPSFSHKILQTFFPIFNSEADVFVHKLGAMVGKSYFSLLDMALRCNVDIACQTTMGTKMNTQNMENEDMLNAFTMVKFLGGLRLTSPILHLDFIYRLTKWYKMQENSRRTLTEFLEKLIKTKLSQKQSVTEKEQKPSLETDDIKKDQCIFIDRAINLAQNNRFTWSDVHNESNMLVAAAIDTTASAITFVIQCLAMYPEHQEKVIEEIRNIFPQDSFEVTYEDTKNMVYCDLVINETLRLFPAGAGQGRRVSKDIKLTDGTILPEDTEIIIDHLGVHRDPSVWGVTANTFDPMRFSETERRKIHPYAHIPFSKGPRNCIGWRYAMFALKVLMAKIFKKYRFTTEQKLEDFKFKVEVTLSSTIKPLVQIHKL